MGKQISLKKQNEQLLRTLGAHQAENFRLMEQRRQLLEREASKDAAITGLRAAIDRLEREIAELRRDLWAATKAGPPFFLRAAERPIPLGNTTREISLD